MTKEHFSPKETIATGRNGIINMHGWNMFTSFHNSIFISPLTSRGKIARCEMEVHEQDLDLFIQHLQELKQELLNKAYVQQSTH